MNLVGKILIFVLSRRTDENCYDNIFTLIFLMPRTQTSWFCKLCRHETLQASRNEKYKVFLQQPKKKRFKEVSGFSFETISYPTFTFPLFFLCHPEIMNSPALSPFSSPARKDDIVVRNFQTMENYYQRNPFISWSRFVCLGSYNFFHRNFLLPFFQKKKKYRVCSSADGEWNNITFTVNCKSKNPTEQFT